MDPLGSQFRLSLLYQVTGRGTQGVCWAGRPDTSSIEPDLGPTDLNDLNGLHGNQWELNGNSMGAMRTQWELNGLNLNSIVDQEHGLGGPPGFPVQPFYTIRASGRGTQGGVQGARHDQQCKQLQMKNAPMPYGVYTSLYELV